MEEQIQQLRRRVSEQVLERAEADADWKRQYIEDPHTAMGGIPEARQLGEMIESILPTDQPPAEATMPTTTWEEYQQLRRRLWEKVLDRATSDPTWKQQLLDDPDTAIGEANFPENQRLNELRQGVEEEKEAEVRGQDVALNPHYLQGVSGFPIGGLYKGTYYCPPPP
jgi:hypothetical protein